MSEALEEQVIIALRRISRAIDLRSRVLLQQHGLTASQLAALRAVSRYQPVSVGGIARVINLSQATVTGVLRRLEKRHLLTRSRSGQDRRNVLIELTPSGREILDSAPPLLQDRFRRRFTQLQGWERTQILTILQRIAAMMDAEKTPPGNARGHERLGRRGRNSLATLTGKRGGDAPDEPVSERSDNPDVEDTDPD